MNKHIIACILIALALPYGVAAETDASASEGRRGAWRCEAAVQPDCLVISSDEKTLDIVVSTNADSAVKQAAKFLASDIHKITGRSPSIVTQSRADQFAIHLLTVDVDTIPSHLNVSDLSGLWEAYRVKADKSGIWLVGSNFRGTAFAAYTLSERIGIDPLYHWTGYTPAPQETLAVRPVRFAAPEPAFKYRGFFHDDEDTLPRPLDHNNYPQYAGGVVPPIWYERYFETALRLRMNQVAPFVRVQRPQAVRQMASDWGLFYSSHHYDILLSNPFGYDRFGLARARGVTGKYEWSTNQAGLLKYWRAGVQENKHLNAIWPVGLRGTADTAYLFPEGTTNQQKGRVFSKVIQDQIQLTKTLVPADKPPVFHFTLYGEMLENYQQGELELPPEVILVWNDDGDGVMRALPDDLGPWKHGIYYHLAYYGSTTKQTHHTITPQRIEEQFRKIVEAGATEYLLVNVSEVREFVMNMRFLAELGWEAERVLAQPNAAERFTRWWASEYFGRAASVSAAATYAEYFSILHGFDQIMYGAQMIDTVLQRFAFRLAGDHHVHFREPDWEIRRALESRLARYAEAFELAESAKQEMDSAQRRFFDENVTLGLLIDYYPTKAAYVLNEAFGTYPDEDAIAKAKEALAILGELEVALEKAERPPFENWYHPTWIRRVDSQTNPHYSYLKLKNYLDRYTPRYK